MDDKPEPAMEAKMPRKMMAEECKASSDGQGYDVRILIDTLTGLVEKGLWSVEMRKPEHFLPSSAEKAVYLSVHGRERRGKTFLLAQISGEPFPSEDKRQRVRTEGISLRHIIVNKDDPSPTKCPSLLLFDTAGSNAPFKLAIKLDRLATDCFSRELVHKVSHINVVVVGYLDLDDQRYLDELATKRNHELKYRKSAFGEVVIVHNFHDLKTVKEVEEQIKRDILDAFDANSECEGTWYKSTHFSHYVLAEHGSEAGKKYNETTIHLLRSKARNLPSEEVHKVFGKIEVVANQLLPVYLMVKEQGAQTHCAKITINGTIEEQKTGQRHVCNFTARELQMNGTVSLKFDEVDNRMSLIKENPVQLSTFLQPGRVSASFLESSVFEPKVDVTITDDHVEVMLDAPGCQVQQEVQGAVLTLKGKRTVVNGSTLAERPSGDFTIILNFPRNWNLSSQEELIDNGVYHLTISRAARGISNFLPRVTKVPIDEIGFMEVIETKDEANGVVLPGREVKFPQTSLVVKNKTPNHFVVHPNTSARCTFPPKFLYVILPLLLALVALLVSLQRGRSGE